MDKVNRKSILEGIGKVYEKAKNCHLEDAFFENNREELSLLAQYFRTSEHQAFLVSMIFTLNYKGETVGIGELIKYFDCNPMDLLAFNDDFEYLCREDILNKQKVVQRLELARANEQFSVNEKITQAILQHEPMPELRQTKMEDILSLLEKLYQLGEQRGFDKLTTSELFYHARELINSNMRFPLIQRIKQFDFNIEDTVLYLYLIWKTLSGKENISIGRALEGIYDKPTVRMHHMQKVLSGNHVLVKNKLAEIVPANFFNDAGLKLTVNSHRLIKESGIDFFFQTKSSENILLPADIVKRELIFDPAEVQQLHLLENLLKDQVLKETQNRLLEKGLPKGITVLLHGVPGSGKTEMVKQLAKATDRAIMKVDISQSKSMWFGESEKLIKRVFTDYQSYANESERTPILLFNEADAIISKRNENSTSTVSQTQNTIQNILLEELENFEGILIGTTNLANSLDPAFDRRFLFKVQFEMPSSAVRAKIWLAKFSCLSPEDCRKLADHFDFSGGQIDNISRKCEIQEVVRGKAPSFENVLAFCREESLIQKENKIGFTRS